MAKMSRVVLNCCNRNLGNASHVRRFPEALGKREAAICTCIRYAEAGIKLHFHSTQGFNRIVVSRVISSTKCKGFRRTTGLKFLGGESNQLGLLFQRIRAQKTTAILNVHVRTIGYPIGMKVKLNLVAAIENFLNYLRKRSMTHCRNCREEALHKEHG